MENASGSNLLFHTRHYMCRKGVHRCCEYILEVRPGTLFARNSVVLAVAITIVALVGCFAEVNIKYLVTLGIALATFLFTMTTSVIKESVLVELELIGIQQTKTYVLGRQTSQIFHKEDISDVVINEAITMNEVVFYLAVLMKDNSIKPLFTNMMPRLACLKVMYKEIQEMLIMKDTAR